MAPYTYYYCFSLILFMGIALWIANLLFLRVSGRTTFGMAFKPGSPEYKRGKRLASNRNLAIASALALVIVVNLVNSLVMVVRLGTRDAHFLLISAPIALGLFFGYMNSRARKQFANYRSDKSG